MKQNITVLINIIMIFVLSFFIYQQYNKQDFYFATTEDGHLVPMVPLSYPSIPSDVVISQTKTAMLESFDFNSENYQTELFDIFKYYNKYGWKDFVKLLEDNRVIEEIAEAPSKSVSVKVLSEPKLMSEGTLYGRYNWSLKVPVEIHIGEKQINNTLEVLVVRSMSFNSPSGVVIEEIAFLDTTTK